MVLIRTRLIHAKDEVLRPLGYNILHEVGSHRLCVLLKLILAKTVLLAKSLLILPTPARETPGRAHQSE